MLIFSLVKGVPAKTTNVVTVGGVLKREEMELVMNPHDMKAMEAADYIRRSVGGKTIALTMGPDAKLSPIIAKLYDAEVIGADEAYVLSDRLMAGADTLATSYTLGMGIKTIVDRHVSAVDQLLDASELGHEQLRSVAVALYSQNLIPNGVFSTLPSARDNLVDRFARGEIDHSALSSGLQEARKDAGTFYVTAGIKSTDGETGSVGPQVAEALSDVLGFELPHATYVDDMEIDISTLTLRCERRLGRLIQTMELTPPAVVTVSPEYLSKPSEPLAQRLVRRRSFRGKVREVRKLNAQEIGADLSRLGLTGSPTIVGPGTDIGKPPVQKIVGKSLVFYKDVSDIVWNGKQLGPFQKGDLAEILPGQILEQLESAGSVGVFTFDMMMEELFG